MSFSDISGSLSDRLRRKREQKTGLRQDEPIDFDELHTLRARILGVLIRDARLAKGCTIDDCAGNLHISPEELTAWEHGKAHPSLPQIELLAYELGVPVSHFWSSDTLTGEQEPSVLPYDEYQVLRDRVVGALLRKARTEAELTPAELAESTGIDVQKINAYELGRVPVPLTELTTLSSAVNVSLSYFLESKNRVGHWLTMQENFQRFNELPEDMRAFVSNPTNASFIELAMWLSEMGVNDLRGIAESILNLSRLNKEDMQKIAEGILNNITL